MIATIAKTDPVNGVVVDITGNEADQLTLSVPLSASGNNLVRFASLQPTANAQFACKKASESLDFATQQDVLINTS